MASTIRARGTGANRARLFTTRMEMLISILSEKGIKIVPGSSPATNGVDTVYMPWIADDATEEDFLKYFCSAAHEQSHFHGKSIVKKMPKKKLAHFCVNAVDDIRCEYLQEEAYPGLVGYRKREYKIDCEGFLKKEFEAANKSDITGLIIAMLKYMIVKNRVRQLKADDVVLYASEDLVVYYCKYLSDIEDVLDDMDGFAHALRVGDVIYNRIKELITDDETEKSKEKGEDGKGESTLPDGESEPGEDGKGEPEEEREAKAKAEEEAAKKAEEDAIKAEVKKKMDELDAEEDMKTVADEYRDDVEAIAAENPAAYRSANGVRDRLERPIPNLTRGFDTLKRGKLLLGSVGSRMTKLFVAQTRKRHLHRQFEGRLDVRAVVGDYSDTRTDLFSRDTPGRLDKAAVSFAVDNSGSMSGERIRKAYEILSGLLYYLDKAGIPCEAMGFTAGTNRSETVRDAAVIHSLIKEFDEPFKKKTISRCYAPGRLAQNIELEALRFLAPRLFQRAEGKKIMFVLSDGEPWFGSYVMEKRMTVAYIAYINRLREMGIYVIGFGIDCDVSEFFGEDSINTKTANLGDAIVKKLTEILNRKG